LAPPTQSRRIFTNVLMVKPLPDRSLIAWLAATGVPFAPPASNH
jgi:hypothetical protein